MPHTLFPIMSKFRPSLRGQPSVYPLIIVWGVLLLTIVGSSLLALWALSNPNYAAVSSPPNGSVPLWCYGAIALTCATGCLLISKGLERED